MRYSFDKIGVYKGISVFRTIIARGDTIITDADFDEMKEHFNSQLTKKWIWVADCANMASTHYLSLSHIYRLYNTLHYDHAHSLQQLWVLNVNPWVQWILTLFMSPKIEILPSDRLELFIQLRKLGCHTTLETQLLSTSSPG